MNRLEDTAGLGRFSYKAAQKLGSDLGWLVTSKAALCMKTVSVGVLDNL